MTLIIWNKMRRYFFKTSMKKLLCQNTSLSSWKDRLCLCLGVCLTFSMLSVSMIAQSQRGQGSATKDSAQKQSESKYFALIIGNNNYQYLDKLKTAVNDAVGLERVLRET